MKVLEIREDAAKIQFSNSELSILANTIRETIAALTREFVARVGASIAEGQKVEDLLTQAIDRNYESIELNLSKLELGILHSCLNEVCYGFKLADFELKIGASREEVRLIFEQVIPISREMRSILDEIKAAFIAKAKLNKKEFLLEGEGYKVSFDLSKRRLRQEEIGVSIRLFLETQISELSLKTHLDLMTTQDVRNFILELENYANSLNKASDDLISPLNIYNDLFQLQVENKKIEKEESEYANLSLMVHFTRSRPKVSEPFLGVKGMISIQNITSFTSSVREFLDCSIESMSLDTSDRSQ
ncbi:hypothetical protein IQ235_16670 [Oscillatoriales cyanobacterium LEGE 11467]|uniref:Uncharacterized protein n=1 Tax=Zarconia navalis LEGE 11467 TaxID=1828826 RepID=A0A928W0T0_9CYAN|nr:hypothetical protein [Zarconia navalis]MBE9042407.1 hypothetical protein [Zarconia navalis LEGE 11467]